MVQEKLVSSEKTKNGSDFNRDEPELRFPEFNDSWKEVKLKDIASFSKGKGISKNEISDEGIPCIRYGELYTKYDENISEIYSKTFLEKDELILSEKNDILIPCSGETAIDLATASCVSDENVAIGGDITIIKTNQYAPFITYCLNNKRTEIAKYAQGVSIVHLYAKDFKDIKLKIPQFSEQKKIVDFLENLNLYIDSLEKKYKLFKNLKNFYLNLIFKDENHTNKNILGNLCNIQTGKLDANAMVDNGKYRFFTCAKGYYKIDNYAFDTEALLIAGNGEVGHIQYYNGKFNAYQRTYVLDNFKEDIQIQYVRYFLEKHLPKQIWRDKQVGSMPYIVLSTLTNMKIFYPNITKQEKIINFFVNFDKKLECMNNQILMLKQFKKAQLQKMFI